MMFFTTANVAERYDTIEVLLDIELESQMTMSVISVRIFNEPTEIEIINDISTESLLTYKESKNDKNDQSTLSKNMIDTITVSSASIWCKVEST